MKRSTEEWWVEIFQVKDDRKKPEIEYSTGFGMHICSFKGKTIYADQYVE